MKIEFDPLECSSREARIILDILVKRFHCTAEVSIEGDFKVFRLLSCALNRKSDLCFLMSDNEELLK